MSQKWLVFKPLIFGLSLLAAVSVPLSCFASEAPTEPPRGLLQALQTQFEGPELAIAFQLSLCESGGLQSARHLNTDGTTDFGAMQINSRHEKEAEALGLDFKGSLLDNVRMARIIYDHQTFSAWLVCSAKIGI